MTLTPNHSASLNSIIEALTGDIHNSPHLCVIDFAGAGAQALSWLHSVGGSSRTVLEATDRYTPRSLIDAIGFTPERFTSQKVAVALAKHAFKRAHTLRLTDAPLFGLGCTATIATDRRKKGEHRCNIAVHDTLGTMTYSLTLSKGLRSRQQEEYLVSLIILKAIADACGVLHFPDIHLAPNEQIRTHFTPNQQLELLRSGEVRYVLVSADEQVSAGDVLESRAVFSGSFNPLHDGHRQLAAVAQEQLGHPVVFELPIVNADKAQIDMEEAWRRLKQFSGFAPVVLTKSPLFAGKVQVFPAGTFVIGADTAARLVEERFYGHDRARMLAALAALDDKGARFLVAGRHRHDVFLTLDDIAVPAEFRHLFTAIPAEVFRKDLSSTQMRELHKARMR